VSNKIFASLLATYLLVAAHLTHAQQSKVYRVGVINEGGFVYNSVVDGLKDSLRELGLKRASSTSWKFEI
jgi:ribosomal protein L18